MDPILTASDQTSHIHSNPPRLMPFLEKIIDKKINNISLTIFESIIDYFCSTFYSAYCDRIKALNNINGDEEDENSTSAQDIAQKVCQFADGTFLYDRTTNGRINIEQRTVVDLTGQKITEPDVITIDGIEVKFSTAPFTSMAWGKAHGTEHVIATDVPECPELVIIYERENAARFNTLKAWYINTARKGQITQTGGQLTLNSKDYFLAQPMPLIQPPQIIQPII